jgi:hypothetical protein
LEGQAAGGLGRGDRLLVAWGVGTGCWVCLEGQAAGGDGDRLLGLGEWLGGSPRQRAYAR